MARYLGIDWDHQQLRVVDAVIRGGRAVVRQAWCWSEELGPNPAQAEHAGRRLRERLQEAGIAAAPVLACVGRDRLIFREVRYPDVPAEEVAAIVRFQATKELAVPAEEVVIDYAPLSAPGPMGERRAVAVMIRKELFNAYQVMCRAAGLRLEAVSARSFGLVANWRAMVGGDGPQAILAICNGSAEFCVARGSELLLGRVLSPAANGEGHSLTSYAGDLRRSLAAYAGQFPEQSVTTLHVAGAAAEIPGLPVPVRGYDPLAGVDKVHLGPAQCGAFAGVLGLLHARAAGQLPVDFLHPKEPKPPDRSRLYLYTGATAAAVLAIFGVGLVFYLIQAGKLDDELNGYNSRRAELQKQIDGMKDVDKTLQPIERWANGESVVLDEFYELVARFPDRTGLRISQLSFQMTAASEAPRSAAPRAGTPAPKPTDSTAKPVGELTFTAMSKSADAIRDLRRALEEGKQWWKIEKWDDRTVANQVKATLKVFRHEPKEYQQLVRAGRNGSGGGAAPEHRSPEGGRP